MSRLPDRGDTKSKLPTRKIQAKSTWFRVSPRQFRSPINWSTSQLGRFNAASHTFGTLYLAENLTGALAESICRGAAYLHNYEKVVPERQLKMLGLYLLELQKPITVVDFTVPNLAKYRLDARITSEYAATRQEGPYRYGPVWADHLSSKGLDGILYPSRHHTSSVCLALFEGTTALKYRFQHDLSEDKVIAILEEEFDWAIELT